MAEGLRFTKERLWQAQDEDSTIQAILQKSEGPLGNV